MKNLLIVCSLVMSVCGCGSPALHQTRIHLTVPTVYDDGAIGYEIDSKDIFGYVTEIRFERFDPDVQVIVKTTYDSYLLSIDRPVDWPRAINIVIGPYSSSGGRLNTSYRVHAVVDDKETSVGAGGGLSSGEVGLISFAWQPETQRGIFEIHKLHGERLSSAWSTTISQTPPSIIRISNTNLLED